LRPYDPANHGARLRRHTLSGQRAAGSG
jgi:hypothetical protein